MANSIDWGKAAIKAVNLEVDAAYWYNTLGEY